MKRKKFFSMGAVTITIFLTMSCLVAFGSDVDVALSEFQKLNIKIVGSAKSFEVQLPAVLSDANFGLKKSICAQGGYDLTVYAGKKVSFIKFPISEKYNFESLNGWALVYENKIVCVYKAVGEGSNLVPGIFPVKDIKEGNP